MSWRSSGVEKTVYVCANAFNKSTEAFNKSRQVTHWYLINLSSKDWSKKKKNEQEPLYIKPILRNILLRWDSCFVALGSTIYCTSASAEDISSDVVAWDTTNTTGEGEPVPPMNLQRERRFTEAVTADGKIYVFGGVKHYYYGFQNAAHEPTIDEKFVCEVFDPSKNEWEPIHPFPPPNLLTMLRKEFDLFVVYDDTERRIILGSRGSHDGVFFTYGVRDATWGTLPQKFTASSSVDMSSRPVFFHNTLYWIEVVEGNIRDCGLYAYDLNLQMLIHGPIMGVNHFFWGCSFGGCIRSAMQLLHFRKDDFYLIWLDKDGVVRFERMRVSKRIDTEKQEGSLTAYVLSTKTYLLDTQAYGIHAVVL